MGFIRLPDDVDFSTKYNTYIIGFCPDIESWFVTNERYFYYEYPVELKTEKDGIEYFMNNPRKFLDIVRQMHYRYGLEKQTMVYLENTKEEFVLEVYAD